MRDAAGGRDADAADVDAAPSGNEADAVVVDEPFGNDAMYFSNASRVTMLFRRWSTVYLKL